MCRSRRHAAVAMFVTLALYVFSRIRRIRSDVPDNESTSSPVTITPLEEAELSESARVLGAAFATEAFTTTVFGGTVRQVENEYKQTIELLLRAHFEAGQPVFTAKTDGEVVGVAAISRPGVSWAPLRLVWLFTRHPTVLIHLFERMDWEGIYHIARTIRPPEGLPSAYYRLEAIGVEPAVQGEGVGRALLDTTHALVEHDPGASGIYLFTGEESLRNLYERFGYGTVGTKQSNEVVAYHMFRPNERVRRDDY
ncbi:GNAT family N-acetyltransferase [Halobacteria archaeon AArc-curdl1]|uniref:GNAT family N-acetyltransferase n=1 Tax=Natronosalvus hydrolyticus TaxID=2979988 RepID=A0AAP2Z907_9EURY|nr:GNAT family N-acetyltransferase [Halobacteria archaeon AArc-curdl1]